MAEDILAILLAPDEPTTADLPTLTVEVTCAECHGAGQHQHVRRTRGGAVCRITTRCRTCQGRGTLTARLLSRTSRPSSCG